VPFVMKAGKALNERKVEIRVQFKPPAAGIHGSRMNEMRNELVVRPAAGASASVTALTWAGGLQCHAVHRGCC